MPGRKIPKYLGLHRQAGIALYRALLLQCRAIPLPERSQTKLQEIVRNRFWYHRNECAPRRIKTQFHAGYAALDLLDASAAGEQSSTARIVDYLGRIPKSASRAPDKHQYREKARRKHGEEAWEPPPDQKFLNVFPRAEADLPDNARQPDGSRKAIYMVNAQKFPFVRFKKPQPKNLTRVLRQKTMRDFRLITRSQRLESYWVPLAEREDAWEAMIKNQLLKRMMSGDISVRQSLAEFKKDEAQQATYSNTFKSVAQQTFDDWTVLRARARVLMGEMQNVVDEENRLAAEEKERLKVEVQDEDAAITAILTMNLSDT